MRGYQFNTLVCVAVVLGLLSAAGQAAAGQIFVTVQGSKQGKFKGELTLKGMEDKIEAVKFAYEVISPRDPATGAILKRMHKPFRITKRWGAASPQLFMALVMNEMLPVVQIDFVSASQAGQMQLTHTVKLTNAFVTEIKQSTEPAQGQLQEYEEVAFVFQKIEINDLIGKTMAMDDWSAAH